MRQALPSSFELIETHVLNLGLMLQKITYRRCTHSLSVTALITELAVLLSLCNLTAALSLFHIYHSAIPLAAALLQHPYRSVESMVFGYDSGDYA